MISIDDVRAAARRLEGVVHRTPVLTSSTLDSLVGGQVLFKAENLQKTGSFKIRGAFNRMACLTDEERARSVVAYSSGNHAQAVAYAAARLDVQAAIVMPTTAPRAKREATEGYGAEVVGYDPTRQAREEIAEGLAGDRGATLIRPFDDPLVMAGQGTAALELLEEVGELDALLVPIGGGGLMAGSSTVARELSASTRIIGVEPSGADDTRRSLEAGARVTVEASTIADGLLAATPGELTFEVNRRLVDEIVTVEDEEMIAAIVFAAERMKTVLEPSGAVGLAAVLNRRVETAGLRLGVILSGGNLGVDRLVGLLGGG